MELPRHSFSLSIEFCPKTASHFSSDALNAPVSRVCYLIVLDKQKPGHFLWQANSAPGQCCGGRVIGGFEFTMMGLTAKLQLRQSQSLVMTPQLMQSIKLLQLTHVELDRFVDEEIERNPLLDRAEPREDAATDQLQKQEALAEPEGDWFENERAWTSEAISDKLDSSLENIFPDDPGTSERLGPDLTAQWKSAGGGSAAGGSADGFDMDDMAAAAITLRDHVGEQIAFAFSDPASRLIARELAENLDDDGYMRADLGRNRGAARRRHGRYRRGAFRLPDVRAGRALRARPRRMPCAAAWPRATGSIRRCGRCSRTSIFWRAATLRR